MFFILSRVLSLTCAFLYPAYASYKTLSKRPASEIDLERWLMYWSVLGVILAAEYVAEWLVRWIPFYWLIKMIFLLYLALPQTEGSTYLYKVYLNPFLNDHESEIDSTIVKVKARVLTYATAKLRAAWDALYSALMSQASSQSTQSAAAAPPGSQASRDAQQPTLMDPMSGPTRMALGLWQSYGPTVVARGTALLAAASAAAQSSAAQAQSQAQGQSSTTPTARHADLSPSSSADELAAQSSAIPAPVSLTAPSSNAYPPVSDNLVQRSRTASERSSHLTPGASPNVGSSMYLPADAPEDTNGRYEQIDHEDFDNENDALLSPSTKVDGQSPTRESGWFGGWGRAAAVEKPKTE